MGRLNLIDLPPEMLIAIASSLGSTVAIINLSRTNRHMHRVLESYIYEYDVLTSEESPRALSAASRFTCGHWDATSIIQKSIAAGADVNASISITPGDYQGREDETYHTTAICMATLTGNAPLVRILLDAGADVNSTCWLGMSVLSYAMRHQHLEIVRMLVAQPGLNMGAWCPQQDAALLTAVSRSAMDYATVLLPLADPNQAGKGGITPLLLAVREQNYDMVALLLADERTDPNDTRMGHGDALQPGAAKSRPQSIFAVACSLPNTDIVKRLHDDTRTEVESGGSEQQSPAWLAFYGGHYSHIQFLIRSNKCQTARHVIFRLACEEHDVELAEGVLDLATPADGAHFESWVEAARAAGLEELATRVRTRWDPS